MKNFMSSLWVTLVICLLGGAAHAMTVEVNPATANGTTIFASLSEAARYIHTNNDAGVPDTINVMVDSLLANDSTQNSAVIDWYDDVTINGNADGNTTNCLLVIDDSFATGNTEYGYFRLNFSSSSVAWGATVTIKNFTIIPKFKSAGASTTATNLKGFFTAAWSATPTSTSGTLNLENLVVTGSLSGDVPANPFVDQMASATRWQRGIHTGSRNAALTSKRTTFNVRNTIISYCVAEAVHWYCDDVDAYFGPGFVLTNSIQTNSFSIVNSGTNSYIHLVGDASNRNLFLNVGDAASDRIINIEAAGTNPNYTASGSELTEIKYTDFVNNKARQAIRLMGGPLRLLDNCMLAKQLNAASGAIEMVNAVANTAPFTVSNCTFYDLASTVTARSIVNGYTTTQSLTNVIFAAGTNEADTTSSTTDMAADLRGSLTSYNYCLFPEAGPNRLHPPYDTTFPPSPANDASYLNPFGLLGAGITFTSCQNVDPQFISTNVVDYPLPASIAAWQASKITLATCNYLRPSNAALVMTGPAGKDLFGVYTSYTPVELSSFATE